MVAETTRTQGRAHPFALREATSVEAVDGELKEDASVADAATTATEATATAETATA